MKKFFRCARCLWVNPRVITRYVTVLGIMAALGACASVPPAQSLMGQWRGELKGFPVLVVYSENSVTVDGSEPVAYQLNGSTVILPEQDNRTYRVEFPAPGEMVQIDDATGARQLFLRVE